MHNSLIEQSIYPIWNGGIIIGQGFVADDYLITAAHVIRDAQGEASIIVNGSKVSLSKLPLLYMGEGDIDKNPNELDVAVWAFKDSPSPLHLSAVQIQANDSLESCMIDCREDKNSQNPQYSLSVLPVTYLGKEEGNYVYCTCNRHEGSSGSPLLMGDNVVGVMHGGKEGQLCAFLKVSAFVDQLKK